MARTSTRAVGLAVLAAAALLTPGGVRAASPASSRAAPLDWAWRLPISGWGEPAIDHSSSYALTRDHTMVALDVETGALRWRAATGGPGDAPLGSAIRLAGPLVIAADDAIVAFDKATGATAWRFVPPGGSSAGPFLGEVVGSIVLVGSGDAHVHALDAATGHLRWSRRVGSPNRTTVFAPVAAAGRIVATFTTFRQRLTGGIAALDHRGRVLWRRRLPRAGFSGAPIVAGNLVVAARTDGTIDAYSLDSGAVRWSLPPAPEGGSPEPRARDIRALTYSAGVLVVSSLTGGLVAVDIDTRRVRWRYGDGPADAAPLHLRSDPSAVYAPYTDGSLVAIALADGRERWRTNNATSSIDWPPAIEGDRLIVCGGALIGALTRWPLDPAAVSASPDPGER